MNIIDIITKEKNGESLSKAEIYYFVNEYVKGNIPDYQISALLMAIYFCGMDEEGIFNLTMAMMHSGDIMDLSSIRDITIDKHSTGGIGDKITLIVAPIWAATGFSVAKMSGRGLGYTGGTIDKLESIPHFTTALDLEDFLRLAKTNKIAITSQSGNLVPADKLLYALRDVTATVDSIPLIAASVMSKKLATGSDVLVLDVKYGRGSFMKTYEKAVDLATTMIKIGEKAGRKVAAVLSPMNCPLGYAVGNSLEVLEALDILSNKGNKKLRDEAIAIGAVGYYIGGITKDLAAGIAKVKKCLEDGSGKEKFYSFVRSQGGEAEKNNFTDTLVLSKNTITIKAPKSGIITDINALGIGMASVELGGGRKKLGENIDHGSGVLLKKTVGDAVKKGDILALLYSNKTTEIMADIAKSLLADFEISDNGKNIPQEKLELIYNNETINLLQFLV
ncbi:MAG: thymidine phosphorylase [Clostridiales bacterium]